MNLRARINRLATHRAIHGERPEVTRIIFTAARRENGEIVADVASAMRRTAGGWETITREEGETEANFIERIDLMDCKGPPD